MNDRLNKRFGELLAFYYSVIALLPVLLVLLLVVSVFCAYRYRQWRLNKKQLQQLNDFYDIVEASPCLQGKPIRIQHTCGNASVTCEKVSRAVCVPPDGSPFFQPSTSARNRPLRAPEQSQKALNGHEVIYHFTQLPNKNKKTTVVHRV
ncbi:unnamed protein product [Caenorhabditis auriculariae]|uniref:Uncharacterized protein n=1 Tax=Caenorhabditis auriculariae TaxID=2777116 RepID=A0A8S1HBB4_9PELO|nr:unnamed protein product [Caenorhabditis auriculariae]